MTGKTGGNCPGPGYGHPPCGVKLTPRRKRCPRCAKEHERLKQKWRYRNDPEFRAKKEHSNAEREVDPRRKAIKKECMDRFNRERDRRARQRRLLREEKYKAWEGIYWVRQYTIMGTGRREPMPQRVGVVGETPHKYRIMCLSEPVRLENNDKRWLDLGEVYMVHKRFVTKLPLEGQPQPPEWMVERSLKDVSKIGRNQPCPCGSGKKYKKCCEYLGVPHTNEQGMLEEERRNPGYIAALIAFCDEKLADNPAAEGFR